MGKIGTKGKNTNMRFADFYVLPEGCIADILSLTTPADVCRLSLVSSAFLSAANSDAIWERFLPSDYQSIISQSNNPLLVDISKKQLYFRLCDEPLLIEDGKKSFFLDKWSGKKCYMIAARDLAIVWGDTPRYWEWISSSESRFEEVAVLRNVCWLEINGKINTSMLSLNTNYAAYLVFKLFPYPYCYGFEGQPADVSVGIIGGERHMQKVFLCLKGTVMDRQFLAQNMDPEEEMEGDYLAENVVLNPEGEEMDGNFAACRRDGWLEIELGEYFSGGDDELEMSLKEVVGGQWKRGLIIQGIEIRPRV